MRIVAVKFLGSEKIYEFFTNLPMITDAIYEITNEEGNTYSTPVVVKGFKKTSKSATREIIKATCVAAPRRPEDGIEHVYFNEEKGTTVVIWKDGVKTKVTCGADDAFDKEKGLAMCYMKRFMNNRGCFNETLKRYCC